MLVPMEFERMEELGDGGGIYGFLVSGEFFADYHTYKYKLQVGQDTFGLGPELEP